jgi:quercetin dioxygenase-like cupin family protein
MRRTPILEKGDVRVVRVESEGEETIPEHTHEVDEIAFNLFFTSQAGKITYKYCDALQKLEEIQNQLS